MITDTLLIVGPGGIGKSRIEKLLRDEIARIDPYRLRSGGPRDRQIKDGKLVGEKDVLYGHPKLRDELYATYQGLGVGLTRLSEHVHWFQQASTLFLKVRDEWQFLL